MGLRETQPINLGATKLRETKTIQRSDIEGEGRTYRQAESSELNSSVLNILVKSCNDKLLCQDEKKRMGNFNVRKRGEQVGWNPEPVVGKKKQC